ncbi:hypothetical protein [Kushneria indalinina]|uniref:hypothetical protein n=1 Tax=Kushneria indalinina TaxID=184067 RepID=UPI000E23A98A|nr:hypothetical protein [Kushneria indalinina]
MNPFKGSRALLFSVLIPIMLPQLMPESVRLIWLLLVALVVLKRMGLINFDLGRASSGDDESVSSKPSDSSRQNHAKNQGEIVAMGSAPYQFNEANRLNYYITLRSKRGDRTIWGIDLKRVAHETPLAVGDNVALEFLGRQSVVVNQPVRNDQGEIVSHREVNTHRHSWAAQVLPA